MWTVWCWSNPNPTHPDTISAWVSYLLTFLAGGVENAFLSASPRLSTVERLVVRAGSPDALRSWFGSLAMRGPHIYTVQSSLCNRWIQRDCNPNNPSILSHAFTGQVHCNHQVYILDLSICWRGRDPTNSKTYSNPWPLWGEHKEGQYARYSCPAQTTKRQKSDLQIL